MFYSNLKITWFHSIFLKVTFICGFFIFSFLFLHLINIIKKIKKKSFLFVLQRDHSFFYLFLSVILLALFL